MASYRLAFRQPTAKDLRPMPNADLVGDPRPPGCEKLSGEERDRVRQGVYRIVYGITDESLVVIVVKVGRRRHVYR